MSIPNGDACYSSNGAAPVSVRGPHPGWPMNRVREKIHAAGEHFDARPPLPDQAQAWVCWCPGPAHKSKAAGGGTRELMMIEYASGCVRAFCFKKCDIRDVLGEFRLELVDLRTGPDGQALPGPGAEEAEVEPPPPLPAYPVDVLPGPLRSLVLAGTAAGLPAELVAGAGLGVASIVTMPAEILPDRDRPTWRETSALWIALLAQTGAGKTPALDLAGRALRELEADSAAAHATDYGAWKVRQEEAKRAKEEFNDAPPKLRQLTVDDITIEDRQLAGLPLLLPSGGPPQHALVPPPGAQAPLVDLLLPQEAAPRVVHGEAVLAVDGRRCCHPKPLS